MTAAAVRDAVNRAEPWRPTDAVGQRQDNSAKQHVAPLDLRALSARGKAPPREWDIDQWMPRAAVLLAGPGGIGKSVLTQQTATAQALQRDYIGHIARPTRVMVWACEDDDTELWRRQEAISDYFGVPLDAPAGRLHLVSRVGRDNTLMAPLVRTGVLAKTNVFEELDQQVNDLSIDSLWVDNVAHVYAGNRDDGNPVTTFINTLMGIPRGRPFSLTLVTHTARAQGSEFAGSAAWENACRARWYFGKTLPDQKADDEDPGDPSVRFLARRKSNYSAQDHVRMSLRNGVLIPDAPPTTTGVFMAGVDDRKAEEVLIAGYKALRGMGLVPTHAKNSPDYLPRDVAAKGLGTPYSASELTRALNRLMGRGVFTVGAAGHYANRNPKQGLILQEGS